MGRPTISAQIKAKALADLHAGDQPAVVAARYGIDTAKVRVWKQRYVTQTVTGAVLIERPNQLAQQLALGDLVMENLRAKLIATQRIAEHAATTEWLGKQTAADVAELFECLDRSAVRILDRLAGGRSTDGDER